MNIQPLKFSDFNFSDNSTAIINNIMKYANDAKPSNNANDIFDNLFYGDSKTLMTKSNVNSIDAVRNIYCVMHSWNIEHDIKKHWCGVMIDLWIIQ